MIFCPTPGGFTTHHDRIRHPGRQFLPLFFLFVLFVKHMPSVSMTEMKETLPEGAPHAD